MSCKSRQRGAVRRLARATGVLCLFFDCAQAGDRTAQDDVGALMHRVEQHMQLDIERHREGLEWREQSSSMRRAIELLDAEKDILEARLEAADILRARREEARASSENERAEREARMLSARQPLEKTRRSLLDAADAIPVMVLADWRERLHALDEAGATRPLTDALRPVLSFALDWQRQQQVTAVGRERFEIQGDGVRRMEVLYLGLSQAWAVSADDAMAGHGVWTGSVWDWRWNPAWAPAIRRALRMHAGNRPPAWTILPVRLSGVSQP